MANHIPVLLQEVVEYLRPSPGQIMVDATFGAGGHAQALLERLRPGGRLAAIDCDPQAVERARALGPDVIALQGNFSNLNSLIRHVLPNSPISGILFDCGISSAQLSDPTLGLSFNIEAPLSMRLDRSSGMTAADIINTWPERDLVRIFREYGEEPAAHRAARAIITSRRQAPIMTTTELAELISSVVRRHKIHPATRIFQALRMAVNEEMENLRVGLNAALEIVAAGGRVAVISFHSLEDRLVKTTFREAARRGPSELSGSSVGQKINLFKIITKHPLRPGRDEIISNPRSRSAKLRVIERLAYAGV